jgi:hypothetical protein
MFMPLLFTSYDDYVQSSKSFQEGLNWMEDLKICQKPTKYGQVMFCEAVKVDMANSKDAFVFFLHDLPQFSSMPNPLCYLKSYWLIQTSACCVAF